MKRILTSSAQIRASQRGVGLVELLVSVAISVILVLGVAMLFLQQSKSYSTQDDLSQVTDSSALLAQVLMREARHAGFLGSLATDTSNTFGANTVVSGANDTGTNSSDEVTFRFFGSVDTSNTVDGSVVDCQGVRPATGATMMVDRFYVAADPANNGEPTLFCDNGTTAVALVPGVESLQILYGEDVNGTGAITRYAPANTAAMGQVKGLLISAVLRGPSNKNPNSPATTFNHFGGGYAAAGAAPAGDAGSVYISPADNRIRRVVRFAVGLRNRLN